VSTLLGSTYKDVGQQKIDILDPTHTFRTMKNWSGLACYATIDSLAAGIFANVLSMRTFYPVFKREYKSGLYSPTVFYFGTWVLKIMMLSFYPVFMYAFLYRSLNVVDQSWDNFFFLMKAAAASSFNATTLGHMWSTFFEDEGTLLSTAFCLQISLGVGGLTVIGKDSSFLSFVTWISPLSKSLELFLRTITSNMQG